MYLYSDNDIQYLNFKSYLLYSKDLNKPFIRYDDFVIQQKIEFKYNKYFNIIIKELNEVKIQNFLLNHNNIEDIAYYLYCLPNDYSEFDELCYTQEDFIKKFDDVNFYIQKAKLLLRNKKLNIIFK